MPDREHGDAAIGVGRHVVHVLPGTRQKETAHAGARTGLARYSGARIRAQPGDRRRKLLPEEAGCLEPVDPPPLRNPLELLDRTRGDEDPITAPHYGRRRSPSITFSAGIPSPRSSWSHASVKAASSRARSTSSRSSPSSTTIRSTSLSSGRSIGSSTLSLPAFTRPFRVTVIPTSVPPGPGRRHGFDRNITTLS